MKSERLRILRAELLADIGMLDELEKKFRLVHAKLDSIVPDEFDYAGLAYTITNAYSLIENYFFRVAKCFENNIEGLTWHRDLIRRMALDIDGIRPALIDQSDVSLFDELRAFRHVFRHIYQSELDIEKLKLVDSRTPHALEAFRWAHDRFVIVLDRLIALVEEGEER